MGPSIQGKIRGDNARKGHFPAGTCDNLHRPTDGGRPWEGGGGWGDGGVIGLARENLGPEGRVGGEYAMEANEMEPGTRDQGGEALNPGRRSLDHLDAACHLRQLFFTS